MMSENNEADQQLCERVEKLEIAEKQHIAVVSDLQNEIRDLSIDLRSEVRDLRSEIGDLRTWVAARPKPSEVQRGTAARNIV